MPRSQTLQIENSAPIETHGIQIGSQVIAHPVDTMVDQGMGMKMRQLDSLLKSGQDLYATIDEGEARQGAEDAALGKPQKSTVLGSYERGWLSTRAAVNSAEDLAKVKTSFESGFDRNTPGGIEGWLQGKYQELTKGMDMAGPYGKVYSQKMAEGFNELRALHNKQTSDSVVAQSESDYITMLHGMVKGKAGQVVSPDDFQSVTKTMADNGIGFDPKRRDDLGKKALMALASEGNVQAIEAAKQATKDGSKPFPSITDDEFAQLEAHAQTVYIQTESRRHALMKQQYEERVNNAMYPVIKMAASGDVEGAQKAYDLLAKSDLFKSHPEDFDKFQKMLVSTGDRAMTLDQRETFNHLYEGIWTGKVGVNDIIRQHLPQKDTMALTTVYMDKWKVDRAAAASEKQADAMNNLFKNQSVMADIRSGLDALPKFPSDSTAAMLDLGGVKRQKMREIHADTQGQLYRAAAESGGDIEAFDRKRQAILDRARTHLEGVLDSKGRKGVMERPAFIHHESWAAYRADYEAGLIPADPEKIQATRAWFMQNSATKPK
ncbi:hypothetical protein [Aquabacterium sp.]|uniref:hypothetical protein n=1 Tax=Aquabacterium sp. TaxID=1872578 RepID=UPI0040383BAB